MNSIAEHEEPEPARTAPSRKLQPGTTLRRLPWLDGKSSLASSPLDATSSPARSAAATRRIKGNPSPRRSPSVVSTASLSPSVISTDSLSPSYMQPTSSSNATPSTARSTVTPPTRRRQSITPASQRPRSSSRPVKPVMRVLASPARPVPPPPARSVPPAISHEPQKRLSIIPAETPDDSVEETRPRAETLAPVPEHLERDDTPESILRPAPRPVYKVSPPRVIKSVHMSPTQPVPRPGAFERVNSTRLNNAIEGLEELVEEAALAAEDTADTQQMEEIYDIVEEAKNALQEVAGDPPTHAMPTSLPHDVSASSEEVSSDEDTDVSSEFSEDEGGPSFVAPVQRNIVGNLKSSPTPRARPVDDSVSSPRDQGKSMDAPSSDAPTQRNVMGTAKFSPAPRPPPVDSVSSPRDQGRGMGAPSVAAPIQRNVLRTAKPSSKPKARPVADRGSDAVGLSPRNQGEGKNVESPSSDRNPGRSRSSSLSNTLLLAPEPAQTAPRDHVDFVLRPMREHSRGRSRRRRTSASEPGARRRRHRPRSDSDQLASSPHEQHQPQNLGSLDDSFEQEDLAAAGKPNGIKRYGTELHIRDQSQNHTFTLQRHHRRQPIARNWTTGKKRLTAAVACINTALLGIIIGIYAGEVPRIQYVLADERHHVIIGNVVLYAGLAISTFISWPLPLLYGRKPYILAALALAMPLQFPQALVVSARRSPKSVGFRTGLLVSRALTGLVLGFANVNFVSTLFDLFGASLQSKHPHQEFTVPSDVRRHGGGMGMWLGIWAWCFIGSLAVGFQIGAAIITSLTPDWGFYICIMILALALLLNVLAPETRRSAYRRSVTEVYDRDENYITRRVARGEIKLHISTEGPKYWFEEVWAGIKLSIMMLCQPGFLVLALYLGWIYAQIVLVIVLLGSLLSREYKWRPEYVGLGVMSIAIGALLAIPLTKAGIFSRERREGPRTDSMTFEKEISWSSHLVRRIIFTLTLPLMGLAYTISSAGKPKPYMVPIVFAGAVGFLSILAIAECYGLIMETFDTCDLQPGVNTRHRLESMAVQDRRRRTNYSSFPRVSAGIFAAQTLSFIGAAVATLVGGIMTRHIGAQASTGVTAGILLFLTILLALILARFKSVQVIPNHTFGTRRDTAAWNEFKELQARGRGDDWKPVVIGNPSGKMRRMSLLELGALSRWTEVRKLNFLIPEKATKKTFDWPREELC